MAQLKYLWWKAVEAIDRSAATLVGDVERPRTLEQRGSKRAWGRLSVLFLLPIGVVGMVIWNSTQQPPLRIKRHWVAENSLDEQVQFMLDNAHQKLATGKMLCPCANPNRAEFFESPPIYFYAIEPDPNTRGAYLRYNLTLPSDAFHAHFDFCPLVVQQQYFDFANFWILCTSFDVSVGGFLDFNKDDDAFLNPVRFFGRVCTGLLGLVQIAIDDKIPSGTADQATIDVKIFGLVAYMWKDMAFTGATWQTWPPPIDANFSEMAKERNTTPVYIQWAGLDVTHVKTSLAIAMEVEWFRYYQVCGPTYCDEFLPTSHRYNLFVSVGLVGGFLSFVVLLLRTFVWPGFRSVCGWSGDSDKKLQVPESTTPPVSEITMSPVKPPVCLRHSRSQSSGW